MHGDRRGCVCMCVWCRALRMPIRSWRPSPSAAQLGFSGFDRLELKRWSTCTPACTTDEDLCVCVCVWQRRRHATALAYMQIAFPALPLTAAAVQAQTSSLFLKSVSAVVSALNVSCRFPEDRGPAQMWRISAWMFLSSIMDACLTAGPWCVRREDGGAQKLKGALEFTGAIIHIWGQTCLHVALNICSECRNLSWCGN